jgi:tetratricopeptide (TPR) repeat protein
MNVVTLFDQAVRAHKCGQLGEAETLYRRILATQPQSFDALHMMAIVCAEGGKYAESETLFLKALSIDQSFPPCFHHFGLLFAKQNRFKEAIEQFDKAIRAFPNFAPAHCDRGSALLEMGEVNEALPSLNTAVTLAPHVPMVWYNRGNVLFKMSDYPAALNDYTHAIALNNNYTDALVGRGNALFKLERNDEALSAFDKALSINPTLTEAYVGRGTVLHILRQNDRAAIAFDKAISLKPDLAEAWLGRGNGFMERRQYSEAGAAFDKALSIDPKLAEAYAGRGTLFHTLRQNDRAAIAFDRAISLKPDLAEAWLGRGNCLMEGKRYDEADVAFDRALLINPNLADGWVSRGVLLCCLNKHEEALPCFDKALSLRSDLPEALFNKSLVKLLQGDFPSGWKLHEARWKCRFWPSQRAFGRPRWTGETLQLRNKTLLVHSERGLGDTIQFFRYLRFFDKLGCKVIFECQKPLVALFENQTLPSTRIVEQGLPLPDFDLHCPLLSLPLVFNSTLETIPKEIPYLVREIIKGEKWHNQLGLKTKPRIGLVWSGNPNFGADLSRSMPLELLLPILTDRMDWYSLQKDIRETDRDVLAKTCILDFTHELADFSETAAAVSELDLVISVDTAVAHLAGALGKPVWILLPFSPDFRWLREVNHSPWYPTATLFRQTQDGDWAGVLRRVHSILDVTNFEAAR